MPPPHTPAPWFTGEWLSHFMCGGTTTSRIKIRPIFVPRIKNPLAQRELRRSLITDNQKAAPRRAISSANVTHA